MKAKGDIQVRFLSGDKIQFHMKSANLANYFGRPREVAIANRYDQLFACVIVWGIIPIPSLDLICFLHGTLFYTPPPDFEISGYANANRCFSQV